MPDLRTLPLIGRVVRDPDRPPEPDTPEPERDSDEGPDVVPPDKTGAGGT